MVKKKIAKKPVTKAKVIPHITLKQKVMPRWVKVISVWEYIVAGLFLVAAFTFIFFSDSLLDTLNESLPSGTPLLTSSMVQIIGFFLIPLAILYFLVGRNLSQGKNWARIVAIVLAALGLIGNVSNLINPISIVELVINGLIVGYLLFSKEAKKAFAPS